MVCRNCGTALEGRFGLGKLFELTPEQRRFVEIFVRCEGKISRVEKELGLSYPTVRNRLEEVIEAMGYPVDEPQPPDGEARRQEILERLARGEITSEEALALMREG
jgi:hypothetical protein